MTCATHHYRSQSKSDSRCGGSRLLYIVGLCLHNVKNGGTLQIVYCGVPPSSYDEIFFADFPRFLESRGLPVGWLPHIFLWHIHPWWTYNWTKKYACLFVCYLTETLRMTKAPSPLPSLKSKLVEMASKGSKESVKSVKNSLLIIPSVTADAFCWG